MPGKAAEIIVTEVQHAILQEFDKSRTESVSLQQRSKIILLGFEGHRNDVIESMVALHRDAVGMWRRR